MSFESPLRTLRESQVALALLTAMIVHAAVVRSADGFIFDEMGAQCLMLMGMWTLGLILAMYILRRALIGPGTYPSPF
jgi:hypothetical protein